MTRGLIPGCLSAWTAVLGLSLPLLAFAQDPVQLSDNCTASVLNRNVQVAADGSFFFPNVPANFGPVRVRATCVQGGATVSGQSDTFVLPANGVVNLPHVQLGNSTPIPTKLTIAAPQNALSDAGSTVQLTVTAPDAQGNPQEVTAATAGTVYRVSNSALATVSPDGLVTAIAPGTVLVQASNEGTQGMLLLRVLFGGESGGGGTSLPQSPADLPAALSSIEVQPSNFRLIVNSLSPLANQQLQVLGHLTDGQTTIDLTSNALWGTNYSSSDLTICNFGAQDGNVLSGTSGQCSITVRVAGLQAVATGTVLSFTPQAVSLTRIPGYANGIDLSGNYAYVAAGSAGLQVVDVSNRRNPVLAASLTLPGNAEGVRVADNRAYVAAGVAGVQIVDVTNPLAPVLLSGITTGGEVRDLVVSGTVIYVSNGAAGLKTIDIGNPAAPVVLGSLGLSGFTKGVTVDPLRRLAVTVGSEGLATIDISNPASPALLGSLNWGGDARKVALKGNFALVADIQTSLTPIDIGNPTSPVLGTSTDPTLGGRLRDLAIVGNLEFGADVYFGWGLPIVDASALPILTPLAIVNLAPPSGEYVGGTGVVADATYLYLTTAANDWSSEKGVTGDTWLYVAAYQPPPNAGANPPTVSIISPSNGGRAFEGDQLAITAFAADDVGIAQVSILVNGQVAYTSTTAPYDFVYSVPPGITTLTISAQVVNLAGETATAQPVTVTVLPGSVSITNPSDGATVIQGALLPIRVDASQNISAVELLVNGQSVVAGAQPPVQFMYRVPLDATTVSIAAQGVDSLGQTKTAQATVNAVPDLRTTVQGRVVDSSSSPVGGAKVLCQGKGATSDADGTFTVPGVRTAQGLLVCSAWATLAGVTNSGSSRVAVPVNNGITDVGTIALSVPNSRGRDFWLVYPGYQRIEQDFGANVFITSDSTANYTVLNAALGFSAMGVVTPGSPAVVPLPVDSFAGASGQTVENAAFHVAADADISVSLSYTWWNYETYLAIPTPSLGTEYFVLSYPSDSSMLAVVASQDTTHLTIDACGTAYAAALDQGQTYSVRCGDVSGAHVVSDKPVAVATGVPFGAEVPTTSSGNGGNLAEMMFPIGGLWGTEIYSPPLSQEMFSVYRITAVADGTTVAADLGGGNIQTLQLNYGQYQELSFLSAGFQGVHFTSNEPVLVMQYGGGPDHYVPLAEGPSSMQLLPVTRFAQSFRFYAWQLPLQMFWYQFTNRAIIIAPSSAVGSVQLNGATVAAASFTPLPGGAYQYAEVPVADGENVVTSPQPIAVYSVGFGARCGSSGVPWAYGSTYGAPAGF